MVSFPSYGQMMMMLLMVVVMLMMRTRRRMGVGDIPTPKDSSLNLCPVFFGINLCVLLLLWQTNFDFALRCVPLTLMKCLCQLFLRLMALGDLFLSDFS